MPRNHPGVVGSGGQWAGGVRHKDGGTVHTEGTRKPCHQAHNTVCCTSTLPRSNETGHTLLETATLQGQLNKHVKGAVSETQQQQHVPTPWSCCAWSPTGCQPQTSKQAKGRTQQVSSLAAWDQRSHQPYPAGTPTACKRIGTSWNTCRRSEVARLSLTRAASSSSAFSSICRAFD